MNIASQIADVGMVHCESLSTWRDGRQIGRPAVVKVNMIIFSIKEKAVLTNRDGGECA